MVKTTVAWKYDFRNGFYQCDVVFLGWRHHVANDPCSFNIDIRHAAISPSIAKWRQRIKLSLWTVLDLIEFDYGAYIYIIIWIRACKKVLYQLVYIAKKFVFLKEPLYLINQ